MFPVAGSLVVQDGVTVTSVSDGMPAALAGLQTGDQITQMDASPLLNVSDFVDAMEGKVPGDVIVFSFDRDGVLQKSSITLGTNPENASRGFLGISVQQHTTYMDRVLSTYGKTLLDLFMWFVPLVYWLVILNLGIGLFNLVPLGPLDGGRMINAILLERYPKEKARVIFRNVSLVFLALILIPIFWNMIF